MLDSDDDDSKCAVEQRKSVKTNLQTKSEYASDDSELVLKSGQRLSDQLVKKGLLTKSMLRQIQQELSENVCKDDDTDSKS